MGKAHWQHCPFLTQQPWMEIVDHIVELKSTGWHIRLSQTSRWHQNKSSGLACPGQARPGQNRTFVLMSTGSLAQPDMSPCIFLSTYSFMLITLRTCPPLASFLSISAPDWFRHISRLVLHLFNQSIQGGSWGGGMDYFEKKTMWWNSKFNVNKILIFGVWKTCI